MHAPPLSLSPSLSLSLTLSLSLSPCNGKRMARRSQNRAKLLLVGASYYYGKINSNLNTGKATFSEGDKSKGLTVLDCWFKQVRTRVPLVKRSSQGEPASNLLGDESAKRSLFHLKPLS